MVEDAEEALKVVGDNVITVQIGHSLSCYPDNLVPCQLSVIDFDPRIIEYEDEVMEGQIQAVENNQISDEEIQERGDQALVDTTVPQESTVTIACTAIELEWES